MTKPPCRTMRLLWLLSFAIFASAPIQVVDAQVVDDHIAANPVLRNLLQPSDSTVNGLDHGILLRQPAVPDGLSAAEQLSSFDKFLPTAFPREAFLRGRISDLPVISREFQKAKGSQDYCVSFVDVYFVTKGTLELFAKREFLESLIDTSDKDDAEGDVLELTAEQLTQAGIAPDSIDNNHEALRLLNANLMDTVVLKGVSRTYWTQTNESIVLAVALDRRFDAQPNTKAQWEKLIQQDDGTYKVDQTGSSYCIGVYLKITPIMSQKDHVLIEAHGAIIQPKVWFRGRDSIGDKLPTAIKQRIPEIRRKIQKEFSSEN